MPRFIYETASSLDGFLADEQHSLDWLFAVAHDEVDTDGLVGPMGALVMGSATYGWLLEHERLLTEPERWQQFYGDRPVYVFSSRTQPVPRGADVRVRGGAVADVLDEITAAAGDRDVWLVGGGDLVGQFFDAGALHRVQITFAPVTLGAGAPLLPRRIESDTLLLQEVRRQGQFVRMVYDVARPVA